MYFLKIERCIEVSTFKLCNSDSMVVSKRSYEQNKGCDFIKKNLILVLFLQQFVFGFYALNSNCRSAI